MRPETDIKGLKEGTWKEHLVRFVFGGVVTVLAGVVAHVWGVRVGGALLAFPAILPASLTLAVKHDGKQCALDEARGATVATAGLAAFGIMIMLASICPFALTLALAVVAWAIVSGVLWLVIYGRRS